MNKTNHKSSQTHCRKCKKSFNDVIPYKYTSKRYPLGYYCTYCVECAKKERRESTKRVQQRGQKFKKYLINLKGNKCSVCGYNDLSCLAVFDFHHIDPNTKEISIGELKNRCSESYKKKVLREIDKCVLVCSNCHRKIHFGKKP